jgi:hypothetical protein
MAKSSNSHRLSHILKCEFNDSVVLLLAEDDTDRGILVGMFHDRIECGEIEIHFPGILGTELLGLQLEYDHTTHRSMEEKEIDKEFITANNKTILIPHERELPSE